MPPHATTTDAPTTDASMASADAAGPGSSASQISAPCVLHTRTNAPRPATPTETSTLPCCANALMVSSGGSTWRHTSSPLRRSSAATTDCDVATSASRCAPDAWKAACVTPPMFLRNQSTLPAWSS